MNLTQNLLDWFDQNRRTHLPWREDPSPYHVWISEIMLQQTQVETVLPYYERFIEALPDVHALADVDEDFLLKLWQGLGYYSRAKNLKKAAHKLVAEFGGEIPNRREDLIGLPGIGPYTAGAILSIAFQEPYLAPDGNLYRVGSRMIMEEEVIEKAAAKSRVEGFLESLMPQDRPGDFNQALMDLGSGICLPHGKPHCAYCPLNEGCLAYRNGLAEEFPRRKEKKKRKKEEKTVLSIRRGERLLLVRRPQSGLLGGLWSLPMIPQKLKKGELEKWLQNHPSGLFSRFQIRENGYYRHIFSHVEWDMVGYLVQLPEEGQDLVGEERKPFLVEDGQREGLEAFEDLTWALPEEVDQDYSIPSAFLPFFTEKQMD